MSFKSTLKLRYNISQFHNRVSRIAKSRPHHKIWDISPEIYFHYQSTPRLFLVIFVWFQDPASYWALGPCSTPR